MIENLHCTKEQRLIKHSSFIIESIIYLKRRINTQEKLSQTKECVVSVWWDINSHALYIHRHCYSSRTPKRSTRLLPQSLPCNKGRKQGSWTECGRSRSFRERLKNMLLERLWDAKEIGKLCISVHHVFGKLPISFERCEYSIKFPFSYSRWLTLAFWNQPHSDRSFWLPMM
jgi:hypothetical protein